MNQDLNVQNVLTLITNIIKEINTTLRAKNYERLAIVVNTLMTIFNVLGINLFINPMTDEQLDVYKKWNDARINKDFDSADVFRNKLVEWKIL